MELKNDTELAVTRRKLQRLEQLFERTRADTTVSDRLRELSQRSIKRLINQLKEEIARYEAHHAVRN